VRRVLLGRQDGARADAVSDALTLPHVCGHEICARVLETDPAGALAPGTLMVVHHVWPCRRCAPCRAGDEQLCREPEAWAGFTDPGGFQEQLVAPLDRLAVVPPGSTRSTPRR
jgi:L-iditol 2-dehydrogenase